MALESQWVRLPALLDGKSTNHHECARRRTPRSQRSCSSCSSAKPLPPIAGNILAAPCPLPALPAAEHSSTVEPWISSLLDSPSRSSCGAASPRRPTDWSALLRALRRPARCHRPRRCHPAQLRKELHTFHVTEAKDKQRQRRALHDRHRRLVETLAVEAQVQVDRMRAADRRPTVPCVPPAIHPRAWPQPPTPSRCRRLLELPPSPSGPADEHAARCEPPRRAAPRRTGASPAATSPVSTPTAIAQRNPPTRRVRDAVQGQRGCQPSRGI